MSLFPSVDEKTTLLLLACKLLGFLPPHLAQVEQNLHCDHTDMIQESLMAMQKLAFLPPYSKLFPKELFSEIMEFSLKLKPLTKVNSSILLFVYKEKYRGLSI